MTQQRKKKNTEEKVTNTSPLIIRQLNESDGQQRNQ